MSVYCYIQDGAVLDCFFLPKKKYKERKRDLYAFGAGLRAGATFFIGIVSQKMYSNEPRQKFAKFESGEIRVAVQSSDRLSPLI